MSAKQFKRDLQKFADAFGIDVNTVVEKVTIDTFIDIVNQTPRDTARAAASWTLTINRPDLTAKPEGDYKNFNATDGIKYSGSINSGTVFYISNGLPYIVPLARGSSTQQPDGWIERILRNRVRYIKKAVNDVTN